MELSSLLFFFIHGKIEDYERLGYLELLAVVVYIKPSKIWHKLRWDRELTISFSSESKILGPWKKLKLTIATKVAEILLVGTELKPSSTWKCPRRKSEASSKLLSESFCCLMLAELEGVATPGDNAAPKRCTFIRYSTTGFVRSLLSDYRKRRKFLSLGLA